MYESNKQKLQIAGIYSRSEFVNRCIDTIAFRFNSSLGTLLGYSRMNDILEEAGCKSELLQTKIKNHEEQLSELPNAYNMYKRKTKKKKVALVLLYTAMSILSRNIYSMTNEAIAYTTKTEIVLEKLVTPEKKDDDIIKLELKEETNNTNTIVKEEPKPIDDKVDKLNKAIKKQGLEYHINLDVNYESNKQKTKKQNFERIRAEIEIKF